MSGIGTSRVSSDRQSRRSAQPFRADATDSWSMIPQDTPANSCSACWASRAVAAGSHGRLATAPSARATAISSAAEDDKTGARRHLARDREVRATERMACPEHRPRDPGDVAEPSAACAAPIGLGRGTALQAVEREFARLAELGGVGAQDAILAWKQRRRRRGDRSPSAGRTRRCNRCARRSG